MVTFFRHLMRQLDREDPGWQENTTFLLDNASWHNSTEMMDNFAKLKLDIIFSAPYSYSAAPIELVFAALKLGDINPGRRSTGKK